jgi:hypothetical protein
MSVDSRNRREDCSPEDVKRQLRALSHVEPPCRLREKLLAAIPHPRTSETSPSRVRWRLGAGSWVGIAATVAVLGGVFWLRLPAGPAPRPQADANGARVRVLASDYNSVRPPDINALDSNSF